MQDFDYNAFLVSVSGPQGQLITKGIQMKTLFSLFAVAALAFTLTGCGDPCKEDKLGNSLATIGKSGLEKDKVIAERTAARAQKCAEKKGAELKKKMGL